MMCILDNNSRELRAQQCDQDLAPWEMGVAALRSYTSAHRKWCMHPASKKNILRYVRDILTALQRRLLDVSFLVRGAVVGPVRHSVRPLSANSYWDSVSGKVKPSCPFKPIDAQRCERLLKKFSCTVRKEP